MLDADVPPIYMSFKIDHAMSCMKGGFVHRRHYEVQDLFATLLKDIHVYHEVEVEPKLQTLTGKVLTGSANSYDEAHLDISEAVFWQRRQCALFFQCQGF